MSMDYVWMVHGVIHREEDEQLVPSIFAKEEDAVDYVQSLIGGAEDWKIEATNDVSGYYNGEHLGKTFRCVRENGETSDVYIARMEVL